jgi:misacylated tRNA(Ala) deacylase
MSAPLYQQCPELREAPSRVRAVTPDGGIVLESSLFFPQGGGQPGDRGELVTGEARVRIGNTVRGEEGAIVLVPEEPTAVLAPGTEVLQVIDAERRDRHTRLHTALHLLSVVLPYPVTGGAIRAEKGRLDFAMEELPAAKEELQARLQALVAADHPVTSEWITEEELVANPDLVKTLSVRPPAGAGRIRLVRIGAGDPPVDLQPCGGTHVARTAAIGRVRLGKVEKKGRQNRRVNLFLVGS